MCVCCACVKECLCKRMCVCVCVKVCVCVVCVCVCVCLFPSYGFCCEDTPVPENFLRSVRTPLSGIFEFGGFSLAFFCRNNNTHNTHTHSHLLTQSHSIHILLHTRGTDSLSETCPVLSNFCTSTTTNTFNYTHTHSLTLTHSHTLILTTTVGQSSVRHG